MGRDILNLGEPSTVQWQGFAQSLDEVCEMANRAIWLPANRHLIEGNSLLLNHPVVAIEGAGSRKDFVEDGKEHAFTCKFLGDLLSDKPIHPNTCTVM
jgi:hypothetical protein